LQYSVISG